ncbi:PREDICTED: uncharacterized protein LOC108766522 [Trachymyrmex cornetzi]|uniref:uncharacterized protein LOC108766522 n=1 Tax=Trachymyrmex cornetzi TaxID=471704 RepID=UPI00084F7096|nr:PREDICTED: uncharacterized protein LOC108766522 [Trachymyrmex cornetzi]
MHVLKPLIWYINLERRPNKLLQNRFTSGLDTWMRQTMNNIENSSSKSIRDIRTNTFSRTIAENRSSRIPSSSNETITGIVIESILDNASATEFCLPEICSISVEN